MAPVNTTTNNHRMFNWDDDDEDDFDLNAWKATVDTSAPSVCELGPLQFSPTDGEGERDETYCCEIILNERALLGTPAPGTKEVDILQSPATFEESEEAPEPSTMYFSSEDYEEELSGSSSSEVASAQYEHIIHALGPHYDGKEEADMPAYPELSSERNQRCQYAKEFQTTRHNTARPITTVYRHSPLIHVTSIDEAHLLSSLICPANIKSAVDQKEIGQYEALQITASEQQELESQNAYEEMDQEIKHMLDEQTERGIDVQMRFSKDELESFFRLWKAQQEDSGDDADGEDVDYSASASDDDADSVDTWELSDVEEEEVSSEPLRGPEDDEGSVTRTQELASSYSADELDFNDVVFGREDGNLGRDEGYVSSSPPVSPVVDVFVDGEKSYMEAGTRRHAESRVDYMYALDEPETISEEEAAFGDNQPLLMADEVKDTVEYDVHNNADPHTIHRTPSPPTATTPPLDIANSPNTLYPASPIASAQPLHDALGIAINAPPPRPTVQYCTSSTASTPSIIPHPNLKSSNQRHVDSRLTRTIAAAWSYTCAFPWTAIGLVTAGAFIGGAVGAVRRR